MSTQTVSVTLASGVVYVSGRVNGTAYTWTQGTDGLWSAVVARADSDVYDIALTAIDAGGNATAISTTVWYGLHLITDRVDGATYGYTDLNRVGAAMIYVADRLQAAGVDVTVSPYLSWRRTDWPTLSAINHYRAQLRTLYAAWAHLPATPSPPDDTNYLTVDDANKIEQILLDLDALLTLTAQACWYSGELICGEV